MTNVCYRKITQSDGTSIWMNQACPGGPDLFRIHFYSDQELWFAEFSYDGGNSWIQHTNPQTTATAMQTALDNYVSQLNAGTA